MAGFSTDSVGAFRFPLQQGRFPHNVGREVIEKKIRLDGDEPGLSSLAKQFMAQLPKIEISFKTLPGQVNIAPIPVQPKPEYETVYDVYNLPDGFRAVFDHGVFGHGDVSQLGQYREQYAGKELRLVPLSELKGEKYTYDKSTGTEVPGSRTDTSKHFVLLVEDKEVPNGGNLAKAMYFAMQAMKEEKDLS